MRIGEVCLNIIKGYYYGIRQTNLRKRKDNSHKENNFYGLPLETQLIDNAPPFRDQFH